MTAGAVGGGVSTEAAADLSAAARTAPVDKRGAATARSMFAEPVDDGSAVEEGVPEALGVVVCDLGLFRTRLGISAPERLFERRLEASSARRLRYL